MLVLVQVGRATRKGGFNATVVFGAECDSTFQAQKYFDKQYSGFDVRVSSVEDIRGVPKKMPTAAATPMVGQSDNERRLIKELAEEKQKWNSRSFRIDVKAEGKDLKSILNSIDDHVVAINQLEKKVHDSIKNEYASLPYVKSVVVKNFLRVDEQLYRDYLDVHLVVAHDGYVQEVCK
jgi:hypothetical protein